MLVLGNQVTRVLERAAESNLPGDIVARVALLGFVQNLTITGPLSLVIAMVLTYGRLAHDGEMSAIRAVGISPLRSARGIALFTVGLAGLLAWLSLSLAPQLAAKEQDALNDALRRAQLAAFVPGQFTALPGTGVTIHVGSVGADGKLKDVLFLQRTAATLEIISAKRASYQLGGNGRSITLISEDGERLRAKPGAAETQRIRFAELDTKVPVPDVERKRLRRDMVASAELWRSGKPEDGAELQWRWSLPLMCIVLAALTLPLSQLRPRQGRYTRVLPVLLLFFLYVNLLAAARSATMRGTLPLMPGLYAVHAAFVALGAGWIGWRWLRQRRGQPA